MSKLEDTAYNYGAEVNTRKPRRIAELEVENDRLREALTTAEYQTQRYKDALDKNASFEKLWEEVSNENDRLREALEKIVERDAYREIIYPSRRYSEAIYGPCAEIARAALAKEAGQ